MLKILWRAASRVRRTVSCTCLSGRSKGLLLSSAAVGFLASLPLLSATGATADLNACINTSNGNIRIVETGVPCRDNERPITIAATGPAGPPGPEGPAGPAGPVGPPGSLDAFEYKVGDLGPGNGKIFFVDYYDQYEGFTYLEIAVVLGVGDVWCDVGGTLGSTRGVRARAVGSGAANTEAISGQCIGGAAVRAANYVANGVAGWYLPSLEELRLAHANLSKVGVPIGDYPLDFATYWTSNQYDFTPTDTTDDVWVVRFFDGEVLRRPYFQGAGVVAVRAF